MMGREERNKRGSKGGGGAEGGMVGLMDSWTGKWRDGGEEQGREGVSG